MDATAGRGEERTDDAKKKPLKEALDDLRTTVPPFDKVERSIHRHVSSMLQVSRDIQDSRDKLVRHLFVNELLKHLPYFFVWQADSAPRDALQKHWETLEEQKTKLEKCPGGRRFFSVAKKSACSVSAEPRCSKRLARCPPSPRL